MMRGALFRAARASPLARLALSQKLPFSRQWPLLQHTLPTTRAMSSTPEGEQAAAARVNAQPQDAAAAAASAASAPTQGSDGQAASSSSSSLRKLDYDEQDDYYDDEPKTFGEKVKFYSAFAAQVTFMLSLAGLAGYMAYELIFSGVSPTQLYDNAFAKLQFNEAVISQMTGEDMRCYGRGGSESRRNQVDSYTYTEENDRPSSKRTRIRFNIEGKKGKALVYAEVSDRLPEGEKFVYLIVQDRRTGRVMTIVDNRDRIEADAAAAFAAAGGSSSSSSSNLGLVDRARGFVGGLFSGGK